MASCQINVTGTTGSVLINHTVNLNTHQILGYIGDPIYIDDTSTNVTYSTIDGDAIASSACLTIINLPSFCYSLKWETDSNYANCRIPKTFVELKLGATTYALNSDYNENAGNLALDINSLGNNNIIATASTGISTARATIINDVILKVYGVNIPELKILNNDGVHITYIKGVVTTCVVPASYETFLPPCPTQNLP